VTVLVADPPPAPAGPGSGPPERAWPEADGGVPIALGGETQALAFATAAAALSAAIGRQQALLADPAGPGGVRMAIHQGEIEPWGDGYGGPVVDRALNLLAAGHPGQILLSPETARAVRPALPAGTSLRDLGVVQLKDLGPRTPVFQLIAPGLPADFPLLPTLDRAQHNLSPQLVPLVGRAPELAAAVAALHPPGSRLLTLVGTAGSGKTRLALQVAAELLPLCPDGAWFVSLAAVTEPEQVGTAIAGVLGLKEGPGRPLSETLSEYVRARQLLLVLDTFEHVVAAAAQIPAWLAAAPGLRVLVTSRAPLHLPGEQIIAIAPLGLPNLQDLPAPGRLGQYGAVALFVQCARTVQPEFRLTAENAPAVAAICVCLEGLPLAIELAAARIPQLAPAALLSRLVGGASPALLPALATGAAHLPARQQTLRAAIGWSYTLLPPPAQVLFARLAVFAGGGTRDAIAAICGADLDSPEAVAAALTILQENSLVRADTLADGTALFRMLATIREYALEQLVLRGEAADLRWQHAFYYRTLAEVAEPELLGPEQARWLTQLEQAHDNFRAVLAWGRSAAGDPELGLRLACALGRFWQVRGYLSEGRARLTEQLSHYPEAPPALRARALTVLVTLVITQGDYAAAATLGQESLAIWRQIGAAAGTARALANLGSLAIYQGDYAQAGRYLEEGRTLFAQVGDRRAMAVALSNLGIVARHQSAYAQAAAYYREGLALLRALGDLQSLAGVLLNLGTMLLIQGEYAEAATTYAESLALRETLQDKRGTALTLSQLAEVATLQGDLPRASGQLAASCALFAELGDKQGLAEAQTNLGTLAYAAGDPARAVALLEQSLTTQRALGNLPGVARTLVAYGQVAAAEGRGAQAQAQFGEAAAFYQQQGDQLGMIRCLEGLATTTGADWGRTVETAATAATLRAALGAPRPPTGTPLLEPTLTTARAALGAAAFAQAWAAGAARSPAAALAVVLSTTA